MFKKYLLYFFYSIGLFVCGVNFALFGGVNFVKLYAIKHSSMLKDKIVQEKPIMKRKVKELREIGIIATIGPSLNSEDSIRQAIDAGVSIFRVNMSHADIDVAQKNFNLIRKVKSNQSILLDIKGPKIRTGKLKNDKEIKLLKDQDFILTTENIIGNNKKVSISYKNLPKIIKKGDRIFLDDGLIQLITKEVIDNTIITTVLNNGILGNKKGINIPDSKNNMNYVSEKDIKDITLACDAKVDFIAASFVRNKQDLLDVEQIIDRKKCPNLKLIAKIENQEGIDNIDEIISIADGIMVARGDMGIEIPFEHVPAVQKMIVTKCNEAQKTVIVATQMLASMELNPRPTRAEVSDVYNAALDGANYTMLSGETSNGEYPIEAIKTMRNIINEALK